MACTRTMTTPILLRRTAPTLPSRSLFNFPSPFGSSSPNSSSGPVKKGTLVKRGSNWVYNEGKVMPYTPEELYTVIADVDSYHQFLPFTSSSKVLSASQLSPPQNRTPSTKIQEKGWLQVGAGQDGQRWVMDAELRIGAMGFDEGYVSKVEMEIPRIVKATAKDASMFRHLVNVWTFTPMSPTALSRPQTQVDLSLEYSFTSPLHAAAISTVWDKVSALMVQKFEERVAHVHGRR